MSVFKDRNIGPFIEAAVFINLIATIILVGILLLATRPSKVERTVLQESAAIKQLIADNAERAAEVAEVAKQNTLLINQLSAAGAKILDELITIRGSLISLYESLLELIKERTEDRYSGSMAREDWQSAVESNENLQMPKRFNK